MIFVTNMRKTPVLAEIVELAAKHTNAPVIYRDTPVSKEEICHENEGYSHVTIKDYGSIWTTEDCDALGDFWKEFDRLEKIVTRPLDEPILPDDHPVVQGYLYVADGRVREFIDGERMTVGLWKNLPNNLGVKEVRRCDIYGRKARLPLEEENKYVPPFERASDGKKLKSNQRQRKPRRTYRINKVVL